MSSPRDILRLMALCAQQFAGDSWGVWRAVLKALFGLPLEREELKTYQALTGRTEPPTEPAKELWAICGRRAGKSIIAALVAVYLSTCRGYSLAPGERGVFMVIASDRRQARVVRRYISGLLSSTPVLAQMVERETKESIDLTTGVSIEIHTASYRSIRGYTVVGAVCDEVAYWPSGDDAKDSDREILTALRPAMATIPEALLLCLSSPYARRGELWRAFQKHYGKEGDPVLVIQAETRQLNPTVPQELIDEALAEDESAAGAEWLGRFRLDVEAFVPLEMVQAVTVPDRYELSPRGLEDGQGPDYVGFIDFAGGSGKDSATLAIAHAEDRDGLRWAVLDLVREERPPFSPAAVCAEFAAELQRFGISRATADRYAADFATEAMRKHGVTLLASDKAKSDIYREFLPLLNSTTVELLDIPRLGAQLVGLERRTARGGRDSIDHGPSGHDDLANAAAGALCLAAKEPIYVELTWGRERLAAKEERQQNGRRIVSYEVHYSHDPAQRRVEPVYASELEAEQRERSLRSLLRTQQLNEAAAQQITQRLGLPVRTVGDVVEQHRQLLADEQRKRGTP